MHVEGKREVCVGAGMCVLNAPRVFDQDENGIVVVLLAEPTGGERDEARQAALLCPSGAIRVSGAPA